jgi:hypothetical protein
MAEESRGGWLSRIGLPGLIISAAALVFQQQQQTFDRLQNNIESGYQFYSANRTNLRYSDDVERELSLLQITGRAFPSIYCDVRADIYQRAFKTEDRSGIAPEAGRVSIDTADIENLQKRIVDPALARPASRPFPESLPEAWLPPYGDKANRDCPALNQPVVARAATPPAPATEARAAPSAPVTSVDANPAQIQPAPVLMRVFFHVPAGGARDVPQVTIAETARSDLAPFNYRVMRGVERVPVGRFARFAEVRYFGEAEEPAARQLANYLTRQFEAEKLVFRLTPIGQRYPNSPHENLEVWIPNPAA